MIKSIKPMQFKLLPIVTAIIMIATLINFSLAGATNKASFCRNYASTAVSQNKQNIRRGCGYRGNRWTNDYKGHYNWCMRVNRSTANSETNARTNDLQRCQQPAMYKSRWDKVGGPGGAWTTGWVYNHTRQVCGHGAPPCNWCPGRQSACGEYPSGSVITHTPYGGSGDCNTRWRLRCTSVPQ